MSEGESWEKQSHEKLVSPVQIGSLTVENRFFLAPLAGISDAPFRRICQEMGAGLTFVDMVAAIAVNYSNDKTLDMLKRHPSEKVLGAQLVGGEPAEIAAAVERLSRMGFDLIDLNFGCPVRKVFGAGGGSGVLRNPELVSSILLAARAATSLPLSVKFRLGISHESITVEDTAARAVAAGVQMLTIHGRTRSDDYRERVSLEGISAGVCATRRASLTNTSHVSVVTVGNGDVFFPQDALRMQAATGCDAVMVARGAFGNPWIFRWLIANCETSVTIAEWQEVVLRHLDYQQEHYGDTSLAAVLIRKHLLWYAKGFPGARKLRSQLCTAPTLAAARAEIKGFAANFSVDECRCLTHHEHES